MMKSTASIEQKIKMYSMSKTDNAYYLKGKAFMELAEITSEKDHVEQAIEAYSAAISIKKDSTYLCERAKAYSKIGMSKEVVSDFPSIQAILNNDIFTDILKKLHIQYMLEDLMKLDYVQESIVKQQEKQFISEIKKEDINKSEQEILDLTNNIKIYDQLPDNDNSNYLKGKAYVKLGNLMDSVNNYNLAIESFSKAILLSNVGNPSYYYERGNAYKLLNNMEKASEDIKMSKSLLSHATGLHHADISNKLGNIGEYQNKNSDIEKYNKILEKNPLKHQAHNLKGLALKDSGMYNEALESFTKAIELLPKDANYYVHRGEVLYLLDNKEDASNDYAIAEKLLEENKSDYDEFSIMRIKDKISDYKHNYQQDQINVEDLLQQSINEQQNVQNNIMDILDTINMRINERTELYSMALESLAQSHGNEDIIYGMVDDLKVIGNNSNQEDHNDHLDI